MVAFCIGFLLGGVAGLFLFSLAEIASDADDWEEERMRNAHKEHEDEDV